ncbi:transposase [Vibrio parahaemolyticus]|nr:transposase [Vibrio parahaemolyticus]EJB8691081.1 transposase [Vibrio parahaemolyticus]EJG0706098.1 transposase [Vibrio parahaemolyticus]MBE4498563.1 hypothetical protein [Vibrio parahaemolyticus]
MTLNVSVIKLSPYSPELNLIEQVWRWLRQQWRSRGTADHREWSFLEGKRQPLKRQKPCYF